MAATFWNFNVVSCEQQTKCGMSSGALNPQMDEQYINFKCERMHELLPRLRKPTSTISRNYFRGFYMCGFLNR